MKNHIIIFLSFILIAISSSADELSKTKTEYQAADKKLNTFYTQAKKSLTKEGFQQLQLHQRSWIETRDWFANSQATSQPKETSSEYWDAMKMYTQERVEFLQAWINVKPKDTWEGEYSDSSGGSLTITKENGKLKFSIDVVRGPTFHLGQIDGELSINQQKARYSDDGNPDVHQPGEQTWLDFEQLGDGLQIKISGTNTLPYHGLRAFFDGTYRRIK